METRMLTARGYEIHVERLFNRMRRFHDLVRMKVSSFRLRAQGTHAVLHSFAPGLLR
jgi:hypothetical protein